DCPPTSSDVRASPFHTSGSPRAVSRTPRQSARARRTDREPPTARDRKSCRTPFRTGRRPFFLPPPQRHESHPGITEKPMHLGRRYKSGKPIRIAQSPPDFSHPLIQTSFWTSKK